MSSTQAALPLSLRLALEVKRLGVPMVVVLNMSDLARKRGYSVDRERLVHELGVPVVETVAVDRRGADALVAGLDAMQPVTAATAATPARATPEWREPTDDDVRDTHAEAARIAKMTRG